jgi:hypothetical protein
MELQLNWSPAIAMQVNVTAGVYGEAGCCKTTFFEIMADTMNRFYQPYALTSRLMEDLAGGLCMKRVKIGDEEHDVMVHVLEVENLRGRLIPSITLLDEISDAPHPSQSAAQEWIRKPGVNNWMCAAWNPPEYSTAGTDLPGPVINRMMVTEWDVMTTNWLEGLQSDNGTTDDVPFPEPVIPVVPDNWRLFRPKWSHLLYDFLRKNIDLTQAQPKDPDMQCKPWPSHRSWHNMVKCLAGAEAVGANQTTRMKLISGCVGEGAGRDFDTYLKELSLPDPEQFLRLPHLVREAMPTRGDLVIHVVKGVVAAVENNKTPERWEALCDVLQYGYEQNKEVFAAAIGKAWNIKPNDYDARPREGAFAEVAALQIGGTQ